MRSLKSTILLLAGMALMTSCVSKKKFVELENQKDQLQKEMMETKKELQAQLDDLKSNNEDLQKEKMKISTDLESMKSDMESKIADIQTELNMKEKSLNKVKEDVSSSFATIEKAVSESNAKIKELAGYLYLDVDPNIEYRTASTRLSKDDKKGLEEIATMLKANPELTMVIEGHADKRKMNPGTAYKDNWDLSVSRATEVVRALEKMGVNSTQLIAAGRGDHLPAVTDNPDSKETLQANRRTEFMMLPNIGKLYKMKGEMK